MDFIQIFNLLSGSFLLLLGFFVIFKNPRGPQNRAFLILSIGGSFWVWGTLFSNYPEIIIILDKFPSLGLYDADNFHPSQVGTYVAALVITCVISNKKPEEIPASIFKDERQLLGIDEDSKTKINLAINAVLNRKPIE